MKKTLSIAAVVSVLFLAQGCDRSRTRTERRVENGVEIVVNRAAPDSARAGNEESFEKIFAIDTESEDIRSLGLADLAGFDVIEGKGIFCLRSKGSGGFIYRFDFQGNFVKSFAPQGQGPGEAQDPRFVFADDRGNLDVVDLGAGVLSVFDPQGAFLGRREVPGTAVGITAGPRGNYVILENANDPGTGEYAFILKLCDAGFAELATLDRYGFRFDREKIRAMEPVFCWSVSKDSIFVANEDRGYDIGVYDAGGRLVRRIQNPYRKIPVGEDEKTTLLERFPPPMRSQAVFPEFHPAIRGIAAGDDGTLWVSTFERGDRTGDYLFDRVNPDGALAGRARLNAFTWENHTWAKPIGDRLYVLEEKDSGFKRVAVYAMK